MGLSRLWQQQGKKEEARQLVTKVSGGFTKGFDTIDLKAAKAMLEELPWRRKREETGSDSPTPL